MDDEEMVREGLGQMLSRLGYEADYATDGTQAIKRICRGERIWANI
jgi:CheY-like chemotaxis protein